MQVSLKFAFFCLYYNVIDLSIKYNVIDLTIKTNVII